MKRKSNNNGVKLLIASCSLAATVSGWAILTFTQPNVESSSDPALEPLEESSVVEVLGISSQPPLLSEEVHVPEPEPIPDLSTLPVRGLRRVDAPFLPTLPPSPTPLPTPQIQKGGGANRQVAPAPQPQPQPKPKPKPARRTRSSR